MFGERDIRRHGFGDTGDRILEKENIWRHEIFVRRIPEDMSFSEKIIGAFVMERGTDRNYLRDVFFVASIKKTLFAGSCISVINIQSETHLGRHISGGKFYMGHKCQVTCGSGRNLF